jgi:hypothetical protein
MTETLTLAVYMAVFTGLTLHAASLMRAKAWTSGNDDRLPEP